MLELPAREALSTLDRLPVVVASDRSHHFGVIVDRFLGERDLRVSPLDSRLGKVPNVNSSSVLENGWPVLIIDVEDLIRSIDNMLSGRRLGKLVAPNRREKGSVRRSGFWSSMIRSRSGSSNGSCWKTADIRLMSRSTASTAGMRCALPIMIWWSVMSICRRMDGIQLVRQIKDDSRLKAIPVVIVSYKDREEDRIRGLDAGANSYLTKSSFHDQTFLTTVADLIGEPRE